MQEYIKKIVGSDRCHSSSHILHCHSSSSCAPKATTLIISNDEMKDIMIIVKSLEDSGLLLKRVSETIQNESKEEKGGFLSMLLGTLGASLLGNILAGKGATKSKRQGRGVNRVGEGIVRAGYGKRKVPKKTNKKEKEFLMPPYHLTYFELQKFYQNQTRFNGVYSRDNLSKIKDGTYVINLDEYLILEVIGLLCMYKKILFISIVLE